MNTQLLQRYKLTVLATVVVAGMALSPIMEAMAAVTYLAYKQSITCKNPTITGGKHTTKSNPDGTVTVTCTGKKKQVKVVYE